MSRTFHKCRTERTYFSRKTFTNYLRSTWYYKKAIHRQYVSAKHR